jgi:hypothetical protein
MSRVSRGRGRRNSADNNKEISSMNVLLRKSLLAAAFSLGLTFAGIASAECNPENEVCPPPPPPGDCSPGFYRNHQELWFFVGTPYCDGPLQPTCFDLLFAMDPVNGCKGSNASCGRGAAAAYLNSVTGFDCDD